MGSLVHRYLRGYCLDPGFSTRLDTAAINEVIYRVPFEKLAPGPVGEYIEVMDFDPASDCWYEPVDLASEEIASQQGLAPSEGNPQFHQQFVYAVAMKTIRHFERALGRKIIWNPRVIPPPKGDKHKDMRWDREYVKRLRIYPHAMRVANAYYDSDRVALLFGYFAAADQHVGTNYPGGLIFTCLSPDIVAHEMTHAILDSLHPRYMEDTNKDIAAFHEGFADIVALLQRFTFRELVEQQLYATSGRMDRFNVLGELATQFGEALKGNRGALRSNIGEWRETPGGAKGNGSGSGARREWVPLEPSPDEYLTKFEAHDRGAILVASVFDAFQRIYKHRTQDLLRIASQGTGVLPEGNINTDLTKRLASESSEIAEHLLYVCIRALDYCPPVDVSFGDYLRAMITADLDIAPEDETGYRLALIEAFRARGVFPDRVNTLSVESLRWMTPEFTTHQSRACDWLARELKNDIRELVEAGNREEVYHCSQMAQQRLHGLLNAKSEIFGPAEWENFLNKLGMTSRPVSQLFGRETKSIRFLKDGKYDNSYVPRIEVHTIRPAFRAGRESRQVEQVLFTLTQRVSVDIGEDGEQKAMVFRGGCTIILSLGRLNQVEYVIQKNIRSRRRFDEQVAYMRGETDGAAPSTSLYADEERPWRLSLNLLHQK